jgi:RNA-directed DNA polymerase
MMHGREKSDSAIVAVKPTNKAGQPAAEPVEPRAETKGNAGQQSTRRAQDRESVTQALERVRHAARQRKKERFTALFHHITIELLRLSFFALKRDAAPGVDGVTWQDYEADLDRKIEDLHDRVHRERTGRSRHGDGIYRNLTDDSARSRLPPSKIRFSRGRRSPC